MFPSYISKLTVTATTPILINELRKGKISFSNALCFFANAISQFSQFIYNPGNNVRKKIQFPLFKMKTPISNIKIMHLIMFLHLVSRMESDRKRYIPPIFQDFFIIEIFQKILIKIFGWKWTCESIQRDTKKIFLNYV